MTDAEIADGLNTPATIRTMELKDFFGAIYAAADEADRAGVLADLRPLMKEEATVDMVVNSLDNGDLAGLQMILSLVSADFQPATLAAIDAVIASITLTAGQANWNEDDGEMPAEFTADWVNATLVQAGYVWNGTEWVRA
jgi:hypothetical protein